MHSASEWWATPCPLRAPAALLQSREAWLIDVEGPSTLTRYNSRSEFPACGNLWSVATCARPQQTWGLSESLFCLLAQVFGGMAATVCGAWGQMTHLVPPCSASWFLLDP